MQTGTLQGLRPTCPFSGNSRNDRLKWPLKFLAAGVRTEGHRAMLNVEHMQVDTEHIFEGPEYMPMCIIQLGRCRAPGYYLWGTTPFAMAEAIGFKRPCCFRSPGRMPCPNYEAVEFQPRTVENSAP